MWFLLTILLSDGCHADGPFIRTNDDGRATTFCTNPDRFEVSRETVVGFMSLEACEREARQRWHESWYRTASRCGRLR